jgi:thiamine-phosphate pyrophosphorylase
VLLYYISDRSQFPRSERDRQAQLLERITEAARCGIDFVQLREKDLCARDLESLARSAVEAVRASGSSTRLLINSRTDIAIAVGADGVHLRSNDVSPADVCGIWRRAGVPSTPLIAVSCHTEHEVIEAKTAGAHYVVFGPVFGKNNAAIAARGIEQLRSSSSQGIPVLALGGITAENAASCVHAGAAGVAGIRLFQEGDMEKTVQELRGSKFG